MSSSTLRDDDQPRYPHTLSRDHRWTPSHLSDFVDGDLSPRGRTRLQRHVDKCPDCYRALVTLQRMLDRLHHLPRPDAGEITRHRSGGPAAVGRAGRGLTPSIPATEWSVRLESERWQRRTIWWLVVGVSAVRPTPSRPSGCAACDAAEPGGTRPCNDSTVCSCASLEQSCGAAIRAAVIGGHELDDLAHQACADAMVAITAKLDQFRHESRFTTWAYRFVILEVSNKLSRHFWNARDVSIEREDWDRLCGIVRLGPPAAS